MNSLLPPNRTQLERSISETTAAAEDLPVPISALWNPDTCPARLLPWLAWAFKTPGWRPDLSEAAKRRLIKASIPIHRKRGTIGAVKEAIHALREDNLTFTESRSDPSIPPHGYKVTVDAEHEGYDDKLDVALEAAISDTKNARSYPVGVEIVATVRGNTHYPVSTQSGDSIVAQPWSVETTVTRPPAQQIVASQVGDAIISYPWSE
ncbi:phage tail protein I [Alloalcanivorax xenomutans]|uniref:phage tail protein I n=1 Tax=Alloalcanivorax xenomutans TaxID=1094342 RepID=UPI003BAD752A